MRPAFALFVTVVFYRILAGYFGSEHSWLLNFSPLAAIALCGPLIFPRRVALLLPLGMLLASDIVLNARFGVAPVSVEMLARYVPLALIAWLGLHLQQRRGVGLFLSASVMGSTAFYLVTNTISWMTNPGYTKTLAGLWQALTVGLPGYPPTWMFFRNSLISDSCFAMAFLGCLAFAAHAKTAAGSVGHDTEKSIGA